MNDSEQDRARLNPLLSILPDRDLLDAFRTFDARTRGWSVSDAMQLQIEFECEFARRGLVLAAPVEPTPPALALRQCIVAAERGDRAAVNRLVWSLDEPHVGLLFAIARDHDSIRVRMILLDRLLFLLDWRWLGEEQALRREGKVRRCGLGARGYVALMESRIGEYVAG